MPGPWEKYQQTPAVPLGFRIVSQPTPSQPRFPDVPVQTAPAAPANVFDQFDAPAADPWAAFPDAQPSGAAAKRDRLPQPGPWTKYTGVRSSLATGTSAADPVTLEINGHRVEVDSSFRSMPHDQQQATVDEIAKSLPTAGPWTKYGASASSQNVTQVKAPDGSIVEFPDGTPDDVMAKAMQEKFGGPTAPAPTQYSTAADVGLSFGSGVPRGIVETAMFPVTLSRMVEGAGNYLYNKAENGVRYAIGTEPLSEEELARREAGINASPAYGLQDRTREIMDAVLHKPQTTAGEYAGTLGEFVAPGAVPSKAARLAATGREMAQRVGEDLFGNIVVPAVTSEGAGQATEGTEYEGLSRFLGALFGNVGTAAGRAYNAPEAVVRRATSEMTDADWRRALGLQNNTTGVRLTGPEAISQATNGASALPNLLRVVEGSVDGGARTGPFFAARPGQVDTAVGHVLKQIAPPSARPHSVGPQAAEAAANVIDRTRQGINAQTRPLYDAAQQQIIPQAQFAPIAADPRFAAGLARLRGNPELAPDYAHLPDNSIGVIDAVTKDLAARGEALRNTANPLYGPELASRSTAAAADARNLATTQSPEYAQALAEQEALRRTVLNPLERGPVGRVAAAQDTSTAGNALLPQNPLAGSAGEAGDATRRLVAEDPAATAALVRQNLADRFGRANTETQSGSREFAGAKFHKDVAGNDTRQEVLDAVLREIPGGQAAASMPELLDVLQATGRRKQIGSATEFNRSLNADLGGAASPTGLAIDLVKSLGTSVVRAGDAVKRAALRSNLRALADMFIDPQSVELIRNANNRGATIGIGDALGRTAAEAGGTIYAPPGGR
ncbi:MULTISPECIES: hypothetical protein [unclassified Mesorhizobium]|uniref:hypothetical protein n=1 Tax=unclassified Mesorhizobium TaxID=325217 RepID=UPI000FCBEC55|nr:MULTISPECIES: hypothetical protein [unclassified Mesorhizobium]RUV39977.1 hypothetical protein EOD29_30345 [Mesorhizobium sp. M1A.T.Ca.IN.004.03.1.1]RWK28559.1 MAG: hypothetical protein EOR40_28425 [Mesorhizobium sp.]RWK84298.1 MAG: hypothetical protein EOR52_29220 [Mesorhizobium sp.]TIP15305.1 MAG: hypothetical protein E5X66_30575 [Mesorhizobium sp.]